MRGAFFSDTTILKGLKNPAASCRESSKCKEFFPILNSFANPVASYGECARFAFSRDSGFEIRRIRGRQDYLRQKEEGFNNRQIEIRHALSRNFSDRHAGLDPASRIFAHP
jgi:hypothetical protein